jgi:molybdopterin-containing oxidoreductase family iron-sulfur binding subunit
MTCPHAHEPELVQLEPPRTSEQSSSVRWWSSLDELYDTQEYRDFVEREFAPGASEWKDDVSRRRFLAIMAASFALAGTTGCSREEPEKIIPYVRAPERLIPGKPLYFATATTLGGYAIGLLAESHMGRPTKLEGNPEHPASLGSTDALTQASILSLYDPDRSQLITHDAAIATWDAFLKAMRAELEDQRPKRGAGLRILTQTITSPTLAAQIRGLLDKFPDARWHQYEPMTRDGVRDGARLALGQPASTVYRFAKADVVLSLGSDFLASGPGCVRYARDFASRRSAVEGDLAVNRLYVAETTPTPTGASADHRLRVRASDMLLFARALARRLKLAPADAKADGEERFDAKWLDAVAADLEAHRGKCVVVVGDAQPAAVHALAHAINAELGNVGQTVVHIDPVEVTSDSQVASIQALATDMDAGKVDLLLILDGNPAYDAPVDVGFAEKLLRGKPFGKEQGAGDVTVTVHWSMYADETSDRCDWHVPATHFLESWGDARAFDGTLTLQQPLIAPLMGGRSVYALLSALIDDAPRTDYDVLHDHWKKEHGANSEDAWQQAVHDGLVVGSAFEPKKLEVRAKSDAFVKAVWATQAPKSASGELELVLAPDPSIWDGRFANNGWLQELPKPLTKLTWDNAVLVSPATATRLELTVEDLVELEVGDHKLRAPVWIMPGHADDSLTLHLGYGRSRAGRVGTFLGANAYVLRTTGAMDVASGVQLRKTGERYKLAATDIHYAMRGRDIVRSGTLEEYKADPHFHAPHEHEEPFSMYAPYDYSKGYSWGMAIDLSKCTGCNACVIACQAENNIPVVGKQQVQNGRAMHWMRIDRYYGGEVDDPQTFHQPMLCQHCEQAPCEVVCPVAATVHSPEGLNEMAYNRCVGTRYCANNCPYKVRGFNFFNYRTEDTPLTQLTYNPDVTVRTRGVMEKCSFCVQRIQEAKIRTEIESVRSGQERPIRDGEVVTACQAACPSQAITFGNINDAQSRVAKLKAKPANYTVLGELHTLPRTTYLVKLTNPNPALQPAGGDHEKSGHHG